MKEATRLASRRTKREKYQDAKKHEILMLNLTRNWLLFKTR